MIEIMRIERFLMIAMIFGIQISIPADSLLASPVVTPERQERMDVPAIDLTSAYDAYVGQWSAPDRLGSQYQLMQFALWETEGTVARNRAYALAQGWRRGFVEALDDALLFARKIRASDGEDVLAVSHAFREIGSKQATLLAQRLLVIASTGSSAAEFELAQRILHDPRSAAELEHARFIIRRLADDGYAAALADIIERYRTANGFDRNLQKAYYWALRSRKAGLPVDDQIAELAGKIPRSAQIEAEEWVASGVVASR